MPFPRFETKPLDDTTRRAAGGSFAALTDGITHYELSNPGQSETVILVHGFSVPYFIFDPTFDLLTRSGFRAVRYDLFGRGFSDRPDLPYNIYLFVRQLSDLLDALRLTHPVNLIGLSMGGPITATFTARFPDRVKSLTLIDPAGARPVSLTLLVKVLKLPGVADAIFRLVGSERLIRSVAKDFFDPKLVEHFTARYRVQMQFTGFRRALLSTVRNGMLESFIDSYCAVGRLDKPVLLVWGRDDHTVPFAHSADLRTAMPQAEFHAIEQCGHIPHYEKPDVFNPALLNFLNAER